jgi:hypothetical protein
MSDIPYSVSVWSAVTANSRGASADCSHRGERNKGEIMNEDVRESARVWARKGVAVPVALRATYPSALAVKGICRHQTPWSRAATMAMPMMLMSMMSGGVDGVRGL